MKLDFLNQNPLSQAESFSPPAWMFFKLSSLAGELDMPNHKARFTRAGVRVSNNLTFFSVSNASGLGYTYYIPTAMHEEIKEESERRWAIKLRAKRVLNTGTFAVKFYVGDESWSARSLSAWYRTGVAVFRDGILTEIEQSGEYRDYSSPEWGINYPGSSTMVFLNSGEKVSIGNLPMFDFDHYTRDNHQEERIGQSFEGVSIPDKDWPQWVLPILSGKTIKGYSCSPFVAIENKGQWIEVKSTRRIQTQILSLEGDRLDNIVDLSLDQILKLFRGMQIFRGLCAWKGAEYLVKKLKAVVVDEDKDEYSLPLRLWKGKIPQGKEVAVVEVYCPSTKKAAWLPVPPESRNVWDAVASTFSMTEQEYKPLKQS